MRKFWLILVVLVASLGASLTSIAAEIVSRVLRPPMKHLPTGNIYELRVLYLEDDRLPTLDPAQVTELCAKIENLVKEWFGYRVRMRVVGRRSLSDYFAANERIFRRYPSLIQNFELDPTRPADQGKITEAIARDFRARPLPAIEGYLRTENLGSHAAAVKFAYRQFVDQLLELRAIPLANGKPFFAPDHGRLNSFPHWCALLKEIEEADFIFTNSMVLGADTTMPIYVIARGGVTTGATDNNSHNPFQVAAMVGLFPFLSDAPIFLRERGRISETERLDVIATLCLHELGHFLLRHAENYDHAGCVHRAPARLNYYEWHQAVRKAGPCPLPHVISARFDS
jgi:hypothetical protein